MCISININNIVYPCNICHVNVKNKDSAAPWDICQSWFHVMCNKLNHIDHKYLQGSNDPWYCLSCCSKIFPFGTLKNKDFISSLTNSLSLSLSQQGTNSDNDNESLLSLKPPSDLAVLYNQFNNTFQEKTMTWKTPDTMTLTNFKLSKFSTNSNFSPYSIFMHAL